MPILAKFLLKWLLRPGEMHSFTIRDIENLTGIKAHTLRIWEQRYAFFQPKRKESLHRIYDNEDLKKLLRISFLYHSGWKISKIAALSEDEIRETVAGTSVAKDHVHPVTQLLEAALDFDEGKFSGLLQQITQQIGFERCISDVCYPLLQKIGLLWQTNNVIPGQEHFSSYLIQNRIISETEKLGSSSQKPEIILLCPQGEYHELPLVFINYLLKKNGWGTIYLGSNIKKKELQQLGSIPGIRYLYIHLITNFTGFFADDYLEDVCRSFPDKQILASGEGIRNVQRSFVNLKLFTSDEMIYNFIKTGKKE